MVAVWLAPGYRGSGIAQSLVDFAAWASASGATVLVGDVTEHNPRAQAFYREVGLELLPDRRPRATDPPSIPLIRPEMVLRPCLIERLNAGLDRKLTLISAPVSFGKTTLLSEQVAGRKRPVVRHSLDKSDNDPTNVRRYAIVAWHSWPSGDHPHTPTCTRGRDRVEFCYRTLFRFVSSEQSP